jgi:hypothetical protein
MANAGPYQDQVNPGLFIPSTFIMDVALLQQVEVTSPQFKELLVRLYQNLNIMALAMNRKDSGIYFQQEFINGQIFFPDPTLNSNTSTPPIPRQAFRKVINFGALPNTATKSVPHGLTITSGYTFTSIYGTANDTAGNSYIPLPFASPVLANNIAVTVDSTNVNVTTGNDRTNYTKCYIILEFIKS